MKNIFLTIIGFFCVISSYGSIAGKAVSLISDDSCKSGRVNEVIEYSFELINNQNKKQQYSLKIQSPRNLASQVILLDSLVELAPNEIYKGVVSVIISDRIPVGGSETCTVIAENIDSKKLDSFEFITVRYKEHPFLLVTEQLLEEVKDKLGKYKWAKENFESLISFADKYTVPERKIVLKARNTLEWKSLSYNTSDAEKAFKVLLAYKLTGEKKYLDKAVKFITEACDKEKGYLSIGAATTGVQVHEGNFFMYLAAACDVVYEEGVFSEQEKENIEETFRFYLSQNKESMDPTGIMNHQASANAGAILVAMFLQDLKEVDFLTNAGGGMADQIAKGTMADGWWFEGTVNYCYLVTHKYTTVAQAFENYGWNLFDKRFPVKYKSKDFENIKEGFTGMKFDIWGPMGKNTRGLEDMFMAYYPLMDEDGVVLSTNDSNAPGPHRFYELAYRHFRKDELAWVINHSKRDSWEALVYGVPAIPKVEDPREKSVFASNVGLTALRSQKEGRDINEQIQAFSKYGTHGGWHGHFDRASLIGLQRNGHRYFGTEMAWYGYGKAGYKECIQTSATHNMVIVDELQQEAVPSKQLMFYGGEKMQVNVVETNARWRKIPTFNRQLFPPWKDVDFEQGFEKIQQKRMTIVTDDYVVIADYMNGSKKHTYDFLLHPIGLKSTNGLKTKGTLLDSLSTQNDSPYKYFKNAQWYKMKKRAKLYFEDRDAKLEVYTIWPKKSDVFISNYPNGGKRKDIRNNPERRTYGVRLKSKDAYFLHVLEPFGKESSIEKIVSNSENELTVYLVSGKKQVIKINDFKTDHCQVSMKEYLNNKEIGAEQTRSHE